MENGEVKVRKPVNESEPAPERDPKFAQDAERIRAAFERSKLRAAESAFSPSAFSPATNGAQANGST